MTIKPRSLEHPHQVAVARYLDLCGVLWIHVPNESRRSPVYGARLKAAGMRAGFPDVYVFDRPPNHSDKIGAAIELKPTKHESKYAKPTASQQSWLSALAERDILVAVCHGMHEAIGTLRAWGYDERFRLGKQQWASEDRSRD